MVHVSDAAAAVLGTTVYYLAFVVFKVSARRMPPLRGSRPFEVAFRMLTSPIWLAGGLVLFVGLAYEVLAFIRLPLSLVQPIFAVSLVLLIAFAMAAFGERLRPREWITVLLFCGATVLVGLSTRGERPLTGIDGTSREAWIRAAALAAPALIVAALVWLVGDRRRGGRHARRVAGVAYGVGIGSCAGLAEAGIRGIAAVYSHGHDPLVLIRTPYPYLVFGMAGIALGQLQVALQRCRLAIVATVLTVIGRTWLVVGSGIMFGDAWPHDHAAQWLRAAGFGLALAALLFFPRHERRPAAPRRPEQDEDVAPGPHPSLR